MPQLRIDIHVRLSSPPDSLFFFFFSFSSLISSKLFSLMLTHHSIITALTLTLQSSPWPRPRPTELHLDTISGLHKYTSSPEAGMPRLPFKNNALRKASDEPFFVVYGDEDEEEDEGPLEAKALVEQKLVTREQLEQIGPEGILVGVS